MKHEVLRRMGLLSFLAIGLWAGSGLAAALRMDSRLEKHEFQVEGVTRESWIYVPDSARTNLTPVVFVFHGHGGTARNVASSFATHRHWPEAVSVYMQGLNTPGRLTDPEGKKPGWQKFRGDQGDRDLKFFDAVLAKLKADYRIDEKRIFATGHSNGNAFTYLLWAERGSLLAAVAPSAAAAGLRQGLKLEPKPAMHLAGEKDKLVRFEWQQSTMNEIRRINGCASEAREWAPDCKLYPSTNGPTPVVTYIHPGGHEFTSAAPNLIVRFFKESSKLD